MKLFTEESAYMKFQKILIFTILTAFYVFAEAKDGNSGGGGGPVLATPEEIIAAFIGDSTMGPIPENRIQTYAGRTLGNLVNRIRLGGDSITDDRLKHILKKITTEYTGEAIAKKVGQAKYIIKLKTPCRDENNKPVAAYAKFNDVGGNTCFSASELSKLVPYSSRVNQLVGLAVHEHLHQLGIKSEEDATYVQQHVERRFETGGWQAYAGMKLVLEHLQQNLIDLDQMSVAQTCKAMGFNDVNFSYSELWAQIELEGGYEKDLLVGLIGLMHNLIDYCDDKALLRDTINKIIPKLTFTVKALSYDVGSFNVGTYPTIEN
jgi:hypothetical protein